jgi:hypothetical protein
MSLLGFFIFPLFGFGFVSYFLPTIIALVRERHDKLSIFLLNFFLGWSIVGWVIALVWACKTERVIVVQAPQRY